MVTLPERYRTVLGRVDGGFSRVYFCQDSHLDREVAIKFLKDPNEARRHLDELKALLQMRSKHVVQVFDIVGQADGSIGIVEERISGDDLWDSTLPRASVEDYLKTLWQVACGIADIHNANLVHRDIKPNNMKICPEGIVKIYDFGLARREGADAVTQGFVGTDGFAAPELYQTGSVAFTNAVDTYAFGATAAFLQTGAIPQGLRARGTPVSPALIASLPLGIPKEIKEQLQLCLSFDPALRPSMTTVRDLLARYLLKDKHQALAVYGGTRRLDASNRKVRLALTTIGTIEIEYDGLRFFVSYTNGEVFINNSPATVGMELPGSCVVALGSSQRRSSQRAFITFDVSNPEVVL